MSSSTTPLTTPVTPAISCGPISPFARRARLNAASPRWRAPGTRRRSRGWLLGGEATEAADEAAETLNVPPGDVPVEARRTWVNGARACLGRLLKAAPQLKDAVELGQIALKGLGWG